MNAAARFASWELIILMSGFGVIVFWKLLTGGIGLHQLLYGDLRQRDGSYKKAYSAGRAQMLLFTIFFAMYYLLQVIQDPTKFPDVPNAALVILGGSHAVYLGGKAQAILLGRLKDLIR